MSTEVALVTDGSSGIGEATALRLQELGYTTYAAAHRVERIEHLTTSGIRPLAMDVTDDESIQSGVEQILAEEGRIDVLVNAAGYGSYGALEDVPLSVWRGIAAEKVRAVSGTGPYAPQGRAPTPPASASTSAAKSKQLRSRQSSSPPPTPSARSSPPTSRCGSSSSPSCAVASTNSTATPQPRIAYRRNSWNCFPPAPQR